jgi:hypothetical protein
MRYWAVIVLVSLLYIVTCVYFLVKAVQLEGGLM